MPVPSDYTRFRVMQKLTWYKRPLVRAWFRKPVSLRGNGYLAGSFPDGITTLNGVPVAATVRVHYRPIGGTFGDGDLIATTQSAADGTWRIDGLDPALKYDIIGRLDGQNDVIAANVSPKVD